MASQASQAEGTTIARLSEEVVNRIAAGEVIHRPVSAVKELLENSIDAGASSVRVTANAGGLKQLTIQDNGKGIRRADLDVVCERFYTSKLKEFEDLEQIGTYGFRGEALASISHVARVTITSKTAQQPVAFRASYADGKLVAPGPGKKAAPRPMAGVVGTTIAVDDLFFNVPARKRALRNTADEYARILDVVSKYAIHQGLSEEEKEANRQEASSSATATSPAKPLYHGVGFVCRKSASATPDLHTRETDSRLDNIRTVFGAYVAQECVHLEGECEGEAPALAANDSPRNVGEESPSVTADAAQASLAPRWSFSGYISNANYNRKKSTYIFFINHRLVQCSSLRRAIEGVYAEYLPKGTFPFVYLSIELPPQRIDVNVHPTKREVHFLDEDLVVGRVVQGVRDKLANANSSRVFYTQQTLRVASSQPSQSVAGGDEMDLDQQSVGAHADAVQNGEDVRSTRDTTESPEGKGRHDDAVNGDKKRDRDDADADDDNDDNDNEEEDDDDQDFEKTPPRRTLKRTLSDAASQASEVSRITTATSASRRKPAYRPEKLVRTDYRSSGLDAFLSQQGSARKSKQTKLTGMTSTSSPAQMSASLMSSTSTSSSSLRKRPGVAKPNANDAVADPAETAQDIPADRIRPAFKFNDDMTEEALTLASVRSLVEAFEARRHDAMAKMLRTLVFVGWVDECLCLVQVNTGLYIMDIALLSQELFYQQALRKFGRFERIVLDEPVSIADAVKTALEARSLARGRPDTTLAVDGTTTEADPDPATVATFLAERASMLDEYFRINIDVQSKTLRSLPEILPGHVPRAVSLPVFLLRLFERVEWYDERGCFTTVAEELALYYNDIGPLTPEQRKTFNESDGWRHDRDDRRYIFKNVIMPHMKKLVPNSDHAHPDAGIFRKVAALEKLYRIFERC
ncbi:DNA mismatch repair protein Mlh1 [Hondaea fermentalgiana]|uniref:DNA mismatch repair protein Mlh1 n=1 Tax=Hondaea fermentalgiana TaxID=2315210 RepID=A0A2R5GIF1_9STRA|nr:DNA mismatch repair protein Mlh1 [Hondaea fermentalgiana]|eukprot:GBG29508.1 DNA mismatch repair protein Mlh1 [Hondaea fermentalgiana]